MGNCQAVDAAALVIQHPTGKLERMYWPITASEVMKAHPGHYVSLIIPLPTLDTAATATSDRECNKTVRFTRVKLLRPHDTLVLGRAYRLVTTQEVMKVLRAKKHARMHRNIPESGHELGASSDTSTQVVTNPDLCEAPGNPDSSHSDRADTGHGRQGSGSSSRSGAGRPKSWRPSLQSISESAN